MNTLYLESVAGIAGDMFTASFLDAGLIPDEKILSLPSELKLTGVFVERSRKTKANLVCTHINVGWKNEDWKKHFSEHSHSMVRPAHQHGHSHWHTHYMQILKFINNSNIEKPEKDLATKIFEELAKAEAWAHGCALEEVSFHEVGTIDSILDVIMAARCVEYARKHWNLREFIAAPVKLGRGLVTIEHGTFPVPPPAAAKLSEGMEVSSVPKEIKRENVELSTPTGLAILKVLEPRFLNQWPEGKVMKQGSGAGTMDLESYPNIFRVSLVEKAQQVSDSFDHDEVVEVTCNIDDETPERMGWIIQELIKQGCLDVWTQNVVTKKNRPGFLLALLVEEKNQGVMVEWLLSKTSTFGVRHRKWQRTKLFKKIEERISDGKSVRYKVGMTSDGKKIKEKPEFEDLIKS